jgi:hypothetical protein
MEWLSGLREIIAYAALWLSGAALKLLQRGLSPNAAGRERPLLNRPGPRRLALPRQSVADPRQVKAAGPATAK